MNYSCERMLSCPCLIDVCCDYGVCEKELRERFAGPSDPAEVAEWAADHLIDMQDPEECRECAR